MLTVDELYLYILMRNDMDSLNPGKAMAQASHAYGALKQYAQANVKWRDRYLQWCGITAQEFGTTIVLGGNEGGINGALSIIHRLDLPLAAGWVHDPTYPVQDGAVTHLLPINTCAFVFGAKRDCGLPLTGLRLHP